MFWCSKIKIVGFFPPGTVNTLFFAGFPGDIRKKKPTDLVWWFFPVCNSENVFLVYPRRPCFVVLACLELRKRVPVYHLVVKNDFSCPRSVFVHRRGKFKTVFGFSAEARA